MYRCYFCNGELEFKDKVMRKDTCTHCGRDLHCCLQCRFYDPSYHNDCREPQAEMVRDRDKANMCDFFRFCGAGTSGEDGEEDAREKAKKELDRLFKK